jgi:hypothetical protein
MFENFSLVFPIPALCVVCSDWLPVSGYTVDMPCASLPLNEFKTYHHYSIWNVIGSILYFALWIHISILQSSLSPETPAIKPQILRLATPFHWKVLTPQQNFRVQTRGTLLANPSGFTPFVMAMATYPFRSAPWRSGSISKLQYMWITDTAMHPCCVTVDRFWLPEYLIWCRDLNRKICLGNKKIKFKLA